MLMDSIHAGRAGGELVCAEVRVSMPLDAWLDKLAQPTGAPGGGAACGVMIAIAAALLQMVAGYTPDDPRVMAAGERAVGHRDDALAAAEDDGVRSAQLGAALAESENASGRDTHVREAAVAAATSSARLGEIGAALATELRLIAERGNPNLAADLAVAAAALQAGIRGALTNLRANLDLAHGHREDSDGVDGALTTLADAGERLIVCVTALNQSR